MRWSGRLRKGGTPASHDAECFWPVDPGGFFCAEKDGNIVGTAAVVNYDDRFSFGGFYIIDPAYREHGIGMRALPVRNAPFRVADLWR